MKLTPELKDIALRVAHGINPERSGEYELIVIERFLAALPNSEPVGVVGDGLLTSGVGCSAILNDPLHVGTLLYAAPPIPQDVTFPVILDEERSKYVAREVKYEEKIQYYKAQLAESQAEAAKLFNILKIYAGPGLCDEWYEAISKVDFNKSPDATALNELIAKAGGVMRETCINRAESLNYNGEGVSVAAAIRAIPSVTLEDLKS